MRREEANAMNWDDRFGAVEPYGKFHGLGFLSVVYLGRSTCRAVSGWGG